MGGCKARRFRPTGSASRLSGHEKRMPHSRHARRADGRIRIGAPAKVENFRYRRACTGGARLRLSRVSQMAAFGDGPGRRPGMSAPCGSQSRATACGCACAPASFFLFFAPQAKNAFTWPWHMIAPARYRNVASDIASGMACGAVCTCAVPWPQSTIALTAGSHHGVPPRLPQAERPDVGRDSESLDFPVRPTRPSPTCGATRCLPTAPVYASTVYACTSCSIARRGGIAPLTAHRSYTGPLPNGSVVSLNARNIASHTLYHQLHSLSNMGFGTGTAPWMTRAGPSRRRVCSRGRHRCRSTPQLRNMTRCDGAARASGQWSRARHTSIRNDFLPARTKPPTRHLWQPRTP